MGPLAEEFLVFADEDRAVTRRSGSSDSPPSCT